MMPADSLWTLDELCTRVAEALGEDAPDTLNGRVREVPDRRTVRYYTTLGLIDRPAELRGRTAFYGRKHLLQLVAIKRMQARGLALTEIQQRLLGLTESELLPLAGIADEAASDSGPKRRGRAKARPRADTDAFWRTPPAPLSEPTQDRQTQPTVGEPCPAMRGIRLAEQALLLLEAARPLREDDLAAIRAAAVPLLDLLRTRGLLGPHGDDTTP